MSYQTTEPDVVEGAHPKRRRISAVAFVGVIEVGPFVGAWPGLDQNLA